jgi:hypothetical protein
MTKLSQAFTDYFNQRLKTHPAIEQAGQLSGLGDIIRPSRLKLGVKERKIETMDCAEYPNLSAILYKVYVDDHMSLSVVMAHYKDGTILWLDDHSNNDDYAAFVRREHLWEYLPDRLDVLVNLLINTKFNYLGSPQLVSSKVDIPPYPDLLSEILRADLLQERDKRMMRASALVEAPLQTSGLDGTAQVQFFVWTRIYGKILRLNCRFGPDTPFEYEGDELLERVGGYIVPS